jgi:hypothetical protein
MLIDVFQSDPFTALELTSTIERNPFNPVGLGNLNMFADMPQLTKMMMIEDRNGQLMLIPATPRGAPLTERVHENRSARAFLIPRLAHGDTLYASEIDSIRAFGSETELMQAQQEIARRLSGPTGLQSNMEYTWEYHRMGAIQGLLMDADGSVLYDWYDEFGIQRPEEIGFNLSQATPPEGVLRTLSSQVKRAIIRAGKGAVGLNTRVIALCGDEFWDQFTAHPDVYKTFLNYQAAEALRADNTFETMTFGGIDWINYRGSDDNTTIAIPEDKVKFFPASPQIFQVGWAPAETFDFVNTRGRKQYVIPIIDRDRNSWWRMELYSYPLHICTRPETLLSGRAEA